MPFLASDYHPKWALIRRLILRRAGNRCEWCQARQRRPHPRTGSRVDLAVAHVDRDRSHNRFWNLAALCQACHLAHDRPQHLVSRRAGRAWQQNQYWLDLPAGPLLAAYRAGTVQLVPAARQCARRLLALGRQQPRQQLRLTYQPLLIGTLPPALSLAEVARRRLASPAAAAPGQLVAA